MSIPTVQIKVALRKQEHPEEYCPVKKCLWRTGGGRCPRHQQHFIVEHFTLPTRRYKD